MAKGGVLNEEMRRKTQGSSSQSEVLVIENGKSKSKPRYKNLECHFCHKTGHMQKYCFQWKKENKGKKDKQKHRDDDDDHFNTTTSDDLIILRDHESFNLVSYENMWVVDSGATLHVTPRKDFFTSNTSGDFGVLKMGNDSVSKVTGVGDVCLQTNMGDDTRSYNTFVIVFM